MYFNQRADIYRQLNNAYYLMPNQSPLNQKYTAKQTINITVINHYICITPENKHIKKTKKKEKRKKKKEKHYCDKLATIQQVETTKTNKQTKNTIKQKKKCSEKTTTICKHLIQSSMKKNGAGSVLAVKLKAILPLPQQQSTI